jgi:hypothetical protein
MTQQIQAMEAVINQLSADREGKQAEIQVDRDRLLLEAQKVKIDMMGAESKRMEVDIKRMEAEIKAAESMKETPPDTTAITVKEMDNRSKETELAQRAQIEHDKLEIERDKIVLEQQKIDLERYKAEMDACARMSEAEQINTPNQYPVTNRGADIEREAKGPGV